MLRSQSVCVQPEAATVHGEQQLSRELSLLMPYPVISRPREVTNGKKL